METLFLYNLAILFFALFVFTHLFHWKRNLPPSPTALPIIGHLHLLKKKSLQEALQDLLSQYGPVLFLKFGSRSALVVSSPSAVEECFTTNDIIFANRPRTMSGDHCTYNYTSFAWTPYGHIWRSQRRFAVTQIFSLKSLQKYSATREEEVRCLLRRLFKASSGGGVQKVYLSFLFSLPIINIVMRMFTGKRYIEEDVADTEVEKLLFQNFKDKFYPKVSMNICDFFPILRLIGYKGIEKSIIRFQKGRDEFVQNLVDETRSKRIPTSETTKMFDKNENNSVTESLLSMQESEPETYTDEVIKSNLSMMLVAGTETSATTLEWAMALLLNHPQEMDKVKAEIDSNIGRDRLLKDSDIVKLPHLRNVISETLRLYPPVPLLLPHFSSQSCSVAGYEIPKGTILMVHALALQRDPKLWEEPNEFRPKRFETAPGAGSEGFAAYIPFGMGRRVCPGAAMGMQMVTLVLGTLIQCFEWNKIGAVIDMSHVSGITLNRAKPLEALCNPRQDFVNILAQI